MNTEKQTKTSKPFKKTLIGLGVASAAVGGYFGWRYMKKQKADVLPEETELETPLTTPPKPNTTQHWIKPSTRNDNFPLKKGSKGERVKKYQEYMLRKHGASILPKFGADGDFGAEMQAALQKLGLPLEITQTAYNLIITGENLNFEADKLAKSIFEAALGNKFTQTIAELKKIKSVDQYKKVSAEFENYRLGVFSPRKTLVTGLLQHFTTPSQKSALQSEFARMGLSYDGDKWSLSGISRQLIVTTTQSEVFDMRHKRKIKVAPNTVLGYILQQGKGLTLFESLENNQKLIVPTTHIRLYAKH